MRPVIDKHIKAFAAAFPHTIPVLTGFGILGLTFGILMRTRGYGVDITTLMSTVVFAGSLQYVALTLLTAVFSPLSALAITFLVNARHLFYGLSLLEKFRDTGRYKPYLIFGLCDETFSILCSTDPPEGVKRTLFMFYITLLDHSYWIAGSALGAWLGQFVRFDTRGMDFVLTALFVVIFINQWQQRKNRRPALIGLAIAVVCLLIFGSSTFMLPAMGGILLVLTILRKPLSPEVLP